MVESSLVSYSIEYYAGGDIEHVVSIDIDLPIVQVEAEIHENKYQIYISNYDWLKIVIKFISKFDIEYFRMLSLENNLVNIINKISEIPVIGFMTGLLLMVIAIMIYLLYLMVIYIIILEIKIVFNIIYFIQLIILTIIFHLTYLVTTYTMYPLLIISSIPSICMYYYSKLSIINLVILSLLIFSVLICIAYKLGNYKPTASVNMVIEEVDRRPNNRSNVVIAQIVRR